MGKPPGNDDSAQMGSPGVAPQTVSADAQTQVAIAGALSTFLATMTGYQAAVEARKTMRINTARKLSDQPRITVAFPPCASEMLSLIKSTDTDEVTSIFKEYFTFNQHFTLGQEGVGSTQTDLRLQLEGQLDTGLVTCEGKVSGPNEKAVPGWPSGCCICEPCVTLDGLRNRLPDSKDPGLRRLFVGDVLWLFYFDRMGLNQILGAILDAYAYTGRLPISNGSLEPMVRDDMTALILEIMVRQVKMGLSATRKDQSALFRLVLGWNSNAGRKLNVDSEVNSGFNSLFHKFIHLALEFYRDRRLAQAIKGVETYFVGNVSAATIAALRETIELLKKRFEPFQYGRNYNNALSGIVWVVAALSIIRELVNTLGIPRAMNDPHEFVPAAYDLLVLKRPVTSGDSNRYIVHRDCATNGRDILLDLEVVDYRNDDELTQWLNDVESKVEAYRSAYLAMTGVDIGTKSPAPTIEQQA